MGNKNLKVSNASKRIGDEESSRLYSYLIWCNTYENICYGIPRNSATAFFSGEIVKDVFKAENIDDLVDKIEGKK